MNTAKRLLACGMAAAMVAGLTACDDETPAKQQLRCCSCSSHHNDFCFHHHRP